MNLKNCRPFFELTLLSGAAFVCHALYIHLFATDEWTYFHYSLSQLYGFFFCFSLVIIALLVKMKQKNIDSVGNTFVLLTCIKMAGAYLLLRPILANHHKDISTEKIHFFLVFALFLVFETIVTIRMLNKN